MTAGLWNFRVASKPEVGGGHVARCRVLAGALSRHVPVRIVLDREGTRWRASLTAQGFDVSEFAEADDLSGAVCIVDEYEFGDAELSRWKERVAMLVMFYDTGSLPPSVDVAIRLDGAAERASRPTVTYLDGLQFALVEPAFAEKGKVRAHRAVEHVVVCFGALDSKNGTELALRALDAGWTGAPESAGITVAIGGGAPHLESVRRSADRMRIPTRISVDERNMPELLASADLAVGAGGVGLLERMAAGVPSVTVCVAENQRPLVDLAARQGGTIYAGAINELSHARLAEAVSRLCGDSDLREAMTARGRDLVDGRGGDRLADALLAEYRVRTDQAGSGTAVVGI